MFTLKADWESFRRDVIPRGAPPEQFREMRLAFYAGAHAILCTLQTLDEDTSNEEGVKQLEALRAEIDAFNRDVQNGRA